MKRIQSSKTISAPEMLKLARALERAGYTNTAVGHDHIDFYDSVEIWEVTNAIQLRLRAAGAEGGAVHSDDDIG